jgi:NCAIR mutase (PurE)-related protein
MSNSMHRDNGHDVQSAPYARPDFERAQRKGVPEVILAETKSTAQCVAISRSFLERTGRAILSRVTPELRVALEQEFGTACIQWHEAARAVVIRQEGQVAPADGGRVGILTAGTSDQPAAEEAAVVCREMGCDVRLVYDVGVAGLHRLFAPLEALLGEEGVDVLIVAAGMDGALPSVVSGLADVPVIGLPTSVGYGMGGQGQAALYSMLQTCSPGLAVVNIDNGVGAGAMAGLIANRVALARRKDRVTLGAAPALSTTQEA